MVVLDPELLLDPEIRVHPILLRRLGAGVDQPACLVTRRGS
jgi:hypothetical protein